MLHITCHYYNFVIIYTACLAHLNAHYIHLNTFSTRKSRQLQTVELAAGELAVNWQTTANTQCCHWPGTFHGYQGMASITVTLLLFLRFV